jgi:hypothetical protein
MRKTAEELYINKVNGFLFGLKNKSKKVGEINVEHLFSQIAKTNPAMATDLEFKYDTLIGNRKLIIC